MLNYPAQTNLHAQSVVSSDPMDNLGRHTKTSLVEGARLHGDGHFSLLGFLTEGALAFHPKNCQECELCLVQTHTWNWTDAQGQVVGMSEICSANSQGDPAYHAHTDPCCHLEKNGALDACHFSYSVLQPYPSPNFQVVGLVYSPRVLVSFPPDIPHYPNHFAFVHQASLHSLRYPILIFEGPLRTQGCPILFFFSVLPPQASLPRCPILFFSSVQAPHTSLPHYPTLSFAFSAHPPPYPRYRNHSVFCHPPWGQTPCCPNHFFVSQGLVFSCPTHFSFACRVHMAGYPTQFVFAWDRGLEALLP
mmetsp:Transcript_5241/g.8629  ORF Transcript_5241/g.8629 Transcript_5241/m.8629 type:complete len:305 (-) Transcript_5241:601-1515(-)